jgi:denticleless
MLDLPLTALKYLHQNLTFLVSTNNDKIEILDANRIPYAIKYNKHVENFFCVADENGYLKFFSSFPKLKPIKEICAQKSCIYDIEWLNKSDIACGGGDQIVSIYDTNVGVRTSILKGHTESVKSISQSPENQFVLATGSRDGSILIYDLRCNKHLTQIEPTDNFANADAQTQVTYIRLINSFQFNTGLYAHHMKSSPAGSLLRSKAFTNSSQSNGLLSSLDRNSASGSGGCGGNKKAYPVSCVLFQSEFFLASAGATDGAIKVWDTRKLTSHKKSIESTPIYVIESQPQALTYDQNTLTPTRKSNMAKGYSNILFNSTKSLLYANCMNNSLYEYNFATYLPSHTRAVNTKLNLANNPKLAYHTNTSNFIRSSLSKCDNFLLTGSSDFNAYIYPTSVNNEHSRHFKNLLPAIVLKGHTNEVTAVQWNPLDSNQLVTCSDDHTIRLWNVKRQMDDLQTKECNFLQAEVLNEFEQIQQPPGQVTDDYHDFVSFKSAIRNNPRIYNKYRPHCTGVFDDFLFINYEYQQFMRKFPNKTIADKFASNSPNLEEELCLKCHNINIDQMDHSEYDDNMPLGSPQSPQSKILNSIEKDLSNGKRPYATFLKSGFLSNMPINILEPAFAETKDAKIGEVPKETKSLSGFLMGRRQASSSTLLTSAVCTNTETSAGTTALSSIGNKTKLKAKSIKHKVTSKSNKEFNLTPIRHALLATFTTPTNQSSKKRQLTSPDENSQNVDGPSNPQIASKKRLIMPDCTQSLTGATASNVNSSAASRTILHYFSPKPTNPY